MRSKDTLLRLQRFRCDERRRQVVEIETMIAEFQRKHDDLDQQVKLEESRNGVCDPNHFNYSLTAKAIRTRRDNLMKSIADLRQQLHEAKAALEEAQAELHKAEMLAEKGAIAGSAPAPGAAGQPLPVRS